MEIYGEISYFSLLNISESLPGMDGSQVLILLEQKTDQKVYVLFSSKHFFTFKIITKMNGQNKKEKKLNMILFLFSYASFMVLLSLFFFFCFSCLVSFVCDLSLIEVIINNIATQKWRLYESIIMIEYQKQNIIIILLLL